MNYTAEDTTRMLQLMHKPNLTSEELAWMVAHRELLADLEDDEEETY